MCEKPVLMTFALFFVVFSLLSLDQVSDYMSEFLISLFSEVITVTHDQLRMTHPNDPPVLFIPCFFFQRGSLFLLKRF